MNQWLRHPDVKQAEIDSFEAERAERRGDHALAAKLYQQAAEAFGRIAATVPEVEYARTREDLSAAAVTCTARAHVEGLYQQINDLLAENAQLKREQDELIKQLNEHHRQREVAWRSPCENCERPWRPLDWITRDGEGPIEVMEAHSCDGIGVLRTRRKIDGAWTVTREIDTEEAKLSALQTALEDYDRAFHADAYRTLIDTIREVLAGPLGLGGENKRTVSSRIQRWVNANGGEIEDP